MEIVGTAHLLEQPDVTEGRSIAALFIAREYLAGRYKPQP